MKKNRDVKKFSCNISCNSGLFTSFTVRKLRKLISPHQDFIICLLSLEIFHPQFLSPFFLPHFSIRFPTHFFHAHFVIRRILASAFCHPHFGIRILASAFWHPHFGIRILASAFWHPHFGIRILASAFWHPYFGIRIWHPHFVIRSLSSMYTG